MSQVSPMQPGAVGDASVSASENHANSGASASGANKMRSCAVCRSRKVRCDKLSPCTNCRKANIPCVIPSNDRPPRWARRLDRFTSTNAAASSATSGAPVQELGQGAGVVMERLKKLEALVKELSGQLEQANAAASASAAGSSSGAGSPDHGSHHDGHRTPASQSTALHKNFGRLVLQDGSGGCYFGSGFWSRVSDELEGLKADTQWLATGDSDSEDSDHEDSPPGMPQPFEVRRPPVERHAFLFGNNLVGSSPDLRSFRPLPSQIPFLIENFAENVNFAIQVVFMPDVDKLVRGMRRPGAGPLSPANEALMFSIYYAAITSMESDDVVRNFGAPQAELSLKYRLGLEHSLAMADFLNNPDLALVQAMANFVLLSRRHDSPRFVWMMTGLLIRMAQAIGLHRDGSTLALSPFESEIRRRVWWALCAIDIRASEDQGSEFNISAESWDSKMPLNVNDSDLTAEMKELPPPRVGYTDMTFSYFGYLTHQTTRKMMALGSRNDNSTLEQQDRLLSELFDETDKQVLQYVNEPGSIRHWIALIITRLVICKLTLLVYLPSLFESPNERFSEDVRNKLLISAIELAEYNHSLNENEDARSWRWIYQTYTHWQAVVYLLIESCRRQLSPLMERAWIALHSRWLIPARPEDVNTHVRIWLPLRGMMVKARRHREAELERLRVASPAEIHQLEMSDQKVGIPVSSGPFSAGVMSDEQLLQHWRDLINTPIDAGRRNKSDSRKTGSSQGESPRRTAHQNDGSSPDYGQFGMPLVLGEGSVHQQNMSHDGQQIPRQVFVGKTSAVPSSSYGSAAPGHSASMPLGTPAEIPSDWSGFTPWLWAETDTSGNVFPNVDVNMDIDEETDWNSWLASASKIA